MKSLLVAIVFKNPGSLSSNH